MEELSSVCFIRRPILAGETAQRLKKASTLQGLMVDGGLLSVSLVMLRGRKLAGCSRESASGENSVWWFRVSNATPTQVAVAVYRTL